MLILSRLYNSCSEYLHHFQASQRFCLSSSSDRSRKHKRRIESQSHRDRLRETIRGINQTQRESEREKQTKCNLSRLGSTRSTPFWLQPAELLCSSLVCSPGPCSWQRLLGMVFGAIQNGGCLLWHTVEPCKTKSREFNQDAEKSIRI